MSAAGIPDFVTPTVPKFQGNTLIAMASHGNDSGLAAEFFVEDEYQTYQSQIEGSAIYKPVQKVRIFQPGAKSDIIKHVQLNDEPNSPSHPHRFPGQWAAFLAQQEQVPNGTPLEMCKFIPSHRVKELKAQNFHTAEQIATASDSIIQTLGMDARRLRDLCAAYINEDVKVKELSASLARESEMKADLEMLRRQLADMNARMSEALNAQGKIPASAVVDESGKNVIGKSKGERT